MSLDVHPILRTVSESLENDEGLGGAGAVLGGVRIDPSTPNWLGKGGTGRYVPYATTHYQLVSSRAWASLQGQRPIEDRDFNRAGCVGTLPLVAKD